MSEQGIRSGITYGAGEATPPPDLWARIEQEIDRRERTGRWWRTAWRRTGMVASVLLLCAGLTLAFSPQAKATLERLRVIWTGEVGEVQARVSVLAASLDALMADGTIAALHWEEVADLAEAAQRTGLTPPTLTGDEPVLLRVQVARQAAPFGRGKEYRAILLTYQIAGQEYMTSREGAFLDGVAQPYTGVELTLEEPAQPHQVIRRDGIEALCISDEANFTWCQRNLAGWRITVGGPDPAVVESLIAAVGE